MDCFVVLAGILGVRAHAALTDDDLNTGLLYELFLEFLHTHGGGRSYRNHLKLIILKRADDRTCMENCSVTYINRQFTASLYQATVCHVTAGSHASV